MSIDEAKAGVLLGLTFGSLYPLLDEIDRDDFRLWFVRTDGVPNLKARIKSGPIKLMAGYGYTGDSCPSCGSVKMLRSGTCETCSDCGDSTSCG